MTYTTQSNLDPAKQRRHAQTATVLAALLCVLILSAQQRPAPRGSTRPHTITALAPVAFPVLIDTPAVIEPPQPQPVAEPTLLDRAMAFIEPFEARRHRAYRDTRGHLTIGVGFNLDRAGAAEDLNRLLPDVGYPGYRALRRGDTSLTDAQIDVLLRHDAQRAIDTARRQITGFDTLPMDAQLIVIDMTFNTGSLHKWRKFRAALARRDYTAAADAMHRSLWRRQTGQRAEHLIEIMLDLSRG
jgi:GH24 family phage-related lysozyme (muramidase)